MEGVKLDLEMQVDLGRGYVPSEVNEKYIEVVGTIPMDAIFSPVSKVRYSVEPTRVGHRSDYDKLVLEVWTDGTLKPEDALAEAAKIAKDHFSIFVNFDEGELGADDENDEVEERIRQILTTPVEELELSVRSSNCLKNANIKTIGDLTRKTEDDIAKTRNFGKKSLQEIKDTLKEWNLDLGMHGLRGTQESLETVEAEGRDRMNHKKGFNKLNRNASHRKALIRNMTTVLFKHERIVTTKAKALEVRRFAEKMITRAKEDSVHNRRLVARKIMDEGILVKLFRTSASA